jgi:hypothetical protein
MPDDSELKTVQRLRDEAAADRKAAAADRESAAVDRGQIEHRHREMVQLEASIAKREQALKQAGEPAFLARIAAADKALAEGADSECRQGETRRRDQLEPADRARQA